MDCTLCHQRFDSNDRCPLVLLCGHSFCRSCLQRNSGAPTGGDGQLRCRLCCQTETRAIQDIRCNSQLLEALELIEELQQQLQVTCSSPQLHVDNQPTVPTAPLPDQRTGGLQNLTQHTRHQADPASTAEMTAPLVREITLSAATVTAAMAVAESTPSANASSSLTSNSVAYSVTRPYVSTQLHSSHSAPLLPAVAATVSLPPRPPTPASTAAGITVAAAVAAGGPVTVPMCTVVTPLCTNNSRSSSPVPPPAVSRVDFSRSSGSSPVAGSYSFIPANKRSTTSPFSTNSTVQLNAPQSPSSNQLPFSQTTATSAAVVTGAAVRPGYRSPTVSRSPSSSSLIPDVSSSASFVQRAAESMHSVVSVSQVKESDVQALVSRSTGSGVIMQHFLQQSGIKTPDLASG